MATSKFKFNLEITGFKMEIEGTREDVASISSAIGNQLGKLMQPKGIGYTPPAQETVDGEAEVINEPKQIGSKKSRVGRKRQSNNSTKTKGGSEDLPQFTNDPTKYGTPTQSWPGYLKALWILYVIKQENGIKELAAGVIAKLFNMHFQQAKTIQPNHVSKDLGLKKLNKQNAKALVGDNPNSNPTTWYLLEEGERLVQNTIANQLGENGTSREETAN